MGINQRANTAIINARREAKKIKHAPLREACLDLAKQIADLQRKLEDIKKHKNRSNSDI